MFGFRMKQDLVSKTQQLESGHKRAQDPEQSGNNNSPMLAYSVQFASLMETPRLLLHLSVIWT